MSGSAVPAQPDAPRPSVLPVIERRLLGVLIEKAKTTPDAYPLSVNALVTGSNQKSNRDPLMDLTDLDVDDALPELQKKGLAIKITGGRVVRWRHNLYETWRVDKVELAVLGELLLRGPQTEGELRSRASRMEPIDDLDALRKVLKPLTDRGFVVWLSPEARRGAMLTHGFHDPKELDRLQTLHKNSDAARPTEPAPDRGGASDSLAARLSQAELEIATLKRTVAELTATVQTLSSRLPGGPSA